MITRRTLLVRGAASVGLLAVNACKNREPQVQGTIIGGSRGFDPSSRTILHSLVTYDLASRTSRGTDLGFLSHSLALHPQDKTRAVSFEKHGPGCAEIDLARGLVLQRIAAGKGRQFYGHGVYAPDGHTLFSVETQLSDYSGVINARDATTFASLGEFPSYGIAPHDCALTDDGQALAITNGGGNAAGDPPNLAIVDLQSQKLLEKMPLEDKKINAGHLLLLPGRRLAVISAPRTGLDSLSLGALSLGPRGGELKKAVGPSSVTDKMKGESLSIALDPASGTLAVTNPDGSLVSFWSSADGAFVGSLTLEKARGIALDATGRYFVVSFSAQASLGFIPVATRTFDQRLTIDNVGITGSHLLCLPSRNAV